MVAFELELDVVARVAPGRFEAAVDAVERVGVQSGAEVRDDAADVEGYVVAPFRMLQGPCAAWALA